MQKSETGRYLIFGDYTSKFDFIVNDPSDVTSNICDKDMPWTQDI